jgi:alkane 1-monooxygenase
MTKKPDDQLILGLRKILYLLYLLPLILSLCSLYFASTTGKYNQYGWWLAAVMVLFTGIDHLFGQDLPNPSHDQLKHPEKSICYSFLPFLSLAAVTILSYYGVHFFCNTSELNWSGRIGWIISIGLATIALALSAGHELIHRQALVDKFIGGFLFAFLCNAAYKIYHIRGHHVHVATPADTGFVKLNQSFYHYLPRVLKNTFIDAWLIEKRRLYRKGNSTLYWRNELINWHLVSLTILAIYYFFFGLLGIIFFMGQGLIALITTYLINYIQHYGLERRKLDDGRYEKYSPAHAWNCNFLISNLTTFCLPRHSDHHLNPRQPYYLLRHIEESPQMPMGYFGMFFMALVPSLWFKVMNPLISAYDPKNFQKSAQVKFNKYAQRQAE